MCYNCVPKGDPNHCPECSDCFTSPYTSATKCSKCGWCDDCCLCSAIASGWTGDLKWSLLDNGTLVVYGNGKMKN
jgi:hypothetical protein